MPSDLTVVLENRPGTLAELGEALGQAGVNVEGICGFASEGRGVVHFLVDDAASARRALSAAAIKVDSERPVLVLNVEDRPGEFGKVCRRIASQGVNIELAYLATRTRLVLGVDDMEKARTAM